VATAIRHLVRKDGSNEFYIAKRKLLVNWEFLVTPPLCINFSNIIRVKRRTGVIDLAGAGVNGLEQLIHLLIRHLLAQVCQDVFELANTDEARHILIEDLESTAVLLGVAGVAEAAWSVENALEGLEVDCWRATDTLLVFVLRLESGSEM